MTSKELSTLSKNEAKKGLHVFAFMKGVSKIAFAKISHKHKELAKNNISVNVPLPVYDRTDFGVFIDLNMGINFIFIFCLILISLSTILTYIFRNY